ncbi:MAG: helix-turn-helix domain-containing protein [Pseudomonadota bacterium]
MIKLYIKNIALKIILKQYFTDIDFSDENVADIAVLDNNIKLLIDNKQDWPISKPIIISDLINLIEKAIQHLDKDIILIGPIKFYSDKRLCDYNGELIELTQKETEILSYLVNKKDYVEKSILLQDIWGYSSEITTSTLDTHIYKLRNKFANKFDIIICKNSSLALSNYQKY